MISVDVIQIVNCTCTHVTNYAVVRSQMGASQSRSETDEKVFQNETPISVRFPACFINLIPLTIC
jgi:hypothetical protein